MINDFFNILIPQGFLGIFIIIQLLCSMLLSPKRYKHARLISLVGISLSIFSLSTVQVEPQYFGFRNALMSDNYTLLFHFIILLCGFFVVLISGNHVKSIRCQSFSFHALLLTAILGAMSIVSANDILTLFVSLELLSFPTYFIIASDRTYKSKEAAFKYLITGAVSSGIFLFGASYLYGLTGCINLTEIYEAISEQNPTFLYSMSCVLIVIGLIAKLAIFPFANWVIDVYKGCETSVLAYLSTIPKLALFAIICRLLVFPLSNSFELVFVIGILSLMTAFWANTLAIRSDDIKTILACSAAANASYIMLTAGLVSVYNLSTVIFYLIAYVLINISVFSFLNILESNKIYLSVNNLTGLGLKNFGLAIAYIIAVIALAGFPVTSGFIAKIYLFSAIAHSGLIFIPFLIILLILTVVALFYYLKLIRPIFEHTDNAIKLKYLFSQKFVLYVTAIVTVLIGVYPQKLIELCRFIAYNI
ncbi:NADH-quinone oxidoreductase subunit N [bacterium]|nr:NADH-quinone oxidoreductase subunit N [bacterium]